MPANGGLAPSPERYGGGTPTLKHIIDGLGADYGTAYDPTDTTGIVYVELQATARCIWALWEQNRRLANQWDALRMTDFLVRWEKILACPPMPGDSLVTRRARVAVAQARCGIGTFAAVYSAMRDLLGSTFVGIVTQSSATANVWTPASWPMGTHDASGKVDWYSTIAYVAVQLTKPATMGDEEFYARAASIMTVLDQMLPAWVAFDWFRQDIHGAAGFYLDEINLDNEAFD